MTRSTAIVFLGPSLRADEAKKLCPNAVVWGPARQGDVLRALREQARVIALIDGVFESQPSVWHQELRIALSQGVHVLGASSMGALRAAELAPFGMVGVGEVYRAYAEGRLTDDADVALLHADAEHEHRPLTVPFVNVLATAEHALEHGALTSTEARALVKAARQLHYQERRWPDLLAAVRWSPARKHEFEQFRRRNPQDVKAADARACLVAARELLSSSSAAAPRRLDSLSVWARHAWFLEQGAPPEGESEDGLRTMLIAEWARSLGLAAPSERVAFFERRSAKLEVDAGIRRRCAEALALEELVLAHPELLAAQAPLPAEGRWVDAVRRSARG